MSSYKVYSYRWVILLSMLPVLAITNVFWLTFAPITDTVTKYYNVSPLKIAFLSMSYMIVYIIMALPASWLVDTKGFRISMGIGALLTAVFGLARGIWADNFQVVVAAQLGVAIGQPFLVNSITKVAAKWFPVNERATASGIATMSGYIGMILAMVLTPSLASGFGVEGTLKLYGYAAVVCFIVFIVLAKEKPESPPGPEGELVNNFSLTDIKAALRKRDFKRLFICIFIIMGIFNAIMTWIEDIVKPRGIVPSQAGLIGGVLVVAGLAGAVILPTLSDKLRKRCPFLYWPIIFTIPGFAGLTLFSDFNLLLLSAALMGFFIMGMGPVAFQYGAETAYPVAEGTSYGMLMLAGQVSGILFIYVMDLFRNGATGEMTASLALFILLMAISFFLASGLKESSLISGSDGKSDFSA